MSEVDDLMEKWKNLEAQHRDLEHSKHVLRDFDKEELDVITYAQNMIMKDIEWIKNSMSSPVSKFTHN